MENRHVEAAHQWHYWKHATHACAGSSGPDESVSPHEAGQEQRLNTSKQDEKAKVSSDNAPLRAHEEEGTSPCKDEMYENALLLASLASSSRSNKNENCVQEITGSGEISKGQDGLPSQHAANLPQHVPPQPDPQQQAHVIPRPNIVTPNSSERQFVEELHLYHRVDIPRPDESFYKRQESRDGNGSHPIPKQHTPVTSPGHSVATRDGAKDGNSPSIFRTPQKKRGHDGTEDKETLNPKRRMLSVHHQRSSPTASGPFVSPMPMMTYEGNGRAGPPMSYPAEGLGPNYPSPHRYLHPQCLPPKFDPGPGHQGEELSPSQSPEASYPPNMFPFPPPPHSGASSSYRLPPKFGPRRHPDMIAMHPSSSPPHASHAHPSPFIYPPNYSYLAERKESQYEKGLSRDPKHKQYPAIASVDLHWAYQAGKTIITRSQKWAWRDFPELEAFLVKNREEYLLHSAMNYTQEQKEYNNKLTERLLKVAYNNNYIFHGNDFDFVSIRDRIRCYYKSYVQANKKKGKIVSYPKAKRSLKVDKEENKEEKVPTVTATDTK
jgi:hypothetical protein